MGRWCHRIVLLACVLAAAARAEEPVRTEGDRARPTRVFWGDPHVHTGASADAAAAGCTVGAEQALRFARGEQVTSSTGKAVAPSRPLDWAVVTDHSDDLAEERWKRHTAIVETLDAPGRFTAFIGWEWTSTPGGGDVLHRNVVYRGGKAEADRMAPLAASDGEDPANLWRWMASFERTTGGKVLAIPHGGNLSNGRMFPLADFAGGPMTREYAEMRARWEPLAEVTQMKGDGETHPLLSPGDAFADYERWDGGNLALAPKKPGMLQREYVRRTLQHGLLAEERFGANPFAFGVVGGTGTHTGLTTAAEDGFLGLHPGLEPAADRWARVIVQAGDRKVLGWRMAAGARTGVWATENTRAALWDAMRRREVYATTGPRMTVRFFGGWGFDAQDARTGNLADAGYAKGVPMGGQLRPAPAGAPAPSFLVSALRDPGGANLDRIQIVKGWLDAAGQVHERVHDVAWSGDRKPDAAGTLPAVGDTVDVAGATWTNTIGAPELVAAWTDPAFDAAQRAVYYARVLVIPTPRWTAWDAKRFGVKMAPDVPMVTQERAYTSAIWYAPPR